MDVKRGALLCANYKGGWIRESIIRLKLKGGWKIWHYDVQIRRGMDKRHYDVQIKRCMKKVAS